jgi:hypothetical protein
MLTNDTIRHYFIQGFNKNSTIQDILNRWPTTLNDAITVALEVKIIDRENERMWRHEKNSIPEFIPLYHRPVESQIKLQPEPLVMKPPIQTVLTPMPLAIMPPSESSGTNPPLMETRFEKFRSELKETNEGFKCEIMKTLQAMSEQMSCLVKNQDPNLRQSPHELGMHPSGMWCTTCRQAGHTT